jgi:hypothetical protein
LHDSEQAFGPGMLDIRGLDRSTNHLEPMIAGYRGSSRSGSSIARPLQVKNCFAASRQASFDVVISDDRTASTAMRGSTRGPHLAPQFRPARSSLLSRGRRHGHEARVGRYGHSPPLSIVLEAPMMMHAQYVVREQCRRRGTDDGSLGGR